MDEIDPQHGTSRRSMLKKTAVVGGALVWATPVVQSMSGTAFAAGSPPFVPGPGDRRAAVLTITTKEGSPDVPRLIIENASDPGILLTSFSLTIGDSRFNFDQVQNPRTEGAVGARLISPDRQQGAVRSELLAYSFTGFRSGMDFGFNFRIDIDRDDPTTPNNNTNFRIVLFNNDPGDGSVPNARLTFTFSEGPPLTMELPDGSRTATTYTFTVADPS